MPPLMYSKSVSPHLNCCQPSDCKGSKISSLQINNLDYEFLSDGRKLSYYKVLIFVYNVDDVITLLDTPENTTPCCFSSENMQGFEIRV